MRTIQLLSGLLILPICLRAQTLGTFISVPPTGQTPILTIPATHRLQKISQTGDPLTAGGTLPDNPDFTGYVPINGSSTSGYLSLNHENTPVGGVTDFDLSFNNSTHLWQIDASQALDFSNIVTTERPCSGGLTGWGTVLSGEEAISSNDVNNDGYHDVGWLVESDPASKTVLQKLYKAGKCRHENTCIRSDGQTLYTGADEPTTGYLYKFVATNAGNLADGALYVLRQTGNTGLWLSLPNSTPADCNGTTDAATAAGATNFNGIEDAEIGPDGKVYFTSKSAGVVYRFTDNGMTISNFETFVESINYTVNWQDPVTGATGSSSVPWGIGNDNLAFDNEGNLWVLQDGGQNNIWVVKPNHTTANPQLSLFATTPTGSEPTGITFSPDNHFIFISIQHPSSANNVTVTDAAGQQFKYNKATTLVIARAESLGTPLPLELLSFNLQSIESEHAVQVNWAVETLANIERIDVQRSRNGFQFETLGSITLAQDSSHTFSFTDTDPLPACSYYRLQIVECCGQYYFSREKRLCLKPGPQPLHIYPNPFCAGCPVSVAWAPGFESEEVEITISAADGRLCFHEPGNTATLAVLLRRALMQISAGVYTMEVRTRLQSYLYRFSVTN